MLGEPRAWVFLDLDGCLVDSSTAIPDAMNLALGDIGLPAVPTSIIVPMIGPPLEQFAVRLMGRLGGSEEQAGRFAQAYLLRYEERMVPDSRVYVGIPEAISSLAVRANLAVVTLKRQGLAERLLDALDLAAHIEFVVGADGTETDKAPLLARATDRARPIRSVMVGDQPDDMTAARIAGVPGLGVSWGFGSRQDLIAAGAVAVVDDPKGLPVTIEQVLAGP